MNILFLCEGDPDRTDFGGEQRTHLLYRALQGLGHVRVLAFDRTMTEVPGEKMRGRQSSPGALARLVDHVAWRLYERWLPTCPKLLPFAWTLNVREAFPDVTFDLVVARYLYKVAVVRPWRHASLWIDIDDHPLQVYETMCAAGRGGLLYALGHRFVRFVTDFIVRRAQGCWVANGEQTTWFVEPEKVRALANVPQPVSPSYEPNGPRVCALLTVGYLAYVPNRLGLERFLAEIWPTVHARHPDLSYWIAGRGLPEADRRRWEKLPGVRCLGFVEDLPAIYSKVLATVVPVDVGGGTCIKTLESLAHSRACLTTSFGARGIPEADLAGDANGLLVYDSAETFAAGLSRILDATARRELESRAKAYADAHFSTDSFERQVRAALGAKAD